MRKNLTILAGLSTLLLLTFLWSLSVGAVSIPLATLANSLLDLEGPRQDFIINRSRLPRAVIAILCGGALALSGAIIQAILRNPLASPKIIGINSGAALSVLAMQILLGDAVPVALSAGLGGLLAASLIYALAEFRPMSATRLILIGIAVGFCLDAGVEFILVTSDAYAISAPLVWLTGSLWGRGWGELEAVWLPLLCMIAGAFLLSHRLDIIRLGSMQATSLGMHVRSERLLLLIVATILAAMSVAIVGVLGFVGLMAPHIAKQLTSGAHRTFLPAAMLIGAWLVLIADAAGRALLPPIEISAGILTALFGAPFFILLLVRNQRRTSQ